MAKLKSNFIFTPRRAFSSSTISPEESSFKKRSILNSSTPEVDPATETAVAQLRDEAVTVSNVEMDATILLAETRGVSQQAQFIETVSRMTMLTRLAHIKESKGYKGATNHLLLREHPGTAPR